MNIYTCNIPVVCNLGDWFANAKHTISLTDEEFEDYKKWKAKFQLRKVSLNTYIWNLFWQNN